MQLADALHHELAAQGNTDAAAQARHALMLRLSGAEDYEKVLLRAAAGAGKSYALVRMVHEALSSPNCLRVAVTAFKNKQVNALARRLGSEMGRDAVCLFISDKHLPNLDDDLVAAVTLAHRTSEIPASVKVVISVAAKLGVFGESRRLADHLGPGANGERTFDVLFVDEAWEMALHLYDKVQKLAPVSFGVGDVGQLPPIDPSANPWRGDSRYNPYRAWPTAFEDQQTTFAVDLPAVWRPTAEQLPLWRAFYSDWDRLDCVCAPGDRTIDLPVMSARASAVWAEVASGRPTLLEVEGLDDPEAADIDQPLLSVVEQLLEELLAGGFTCREKTYDVDGRPAGDNVVSSADEQRSDPLVVVLATRNQAVDDAQDMADRLIEKFELPTGAIQASTVDSWQGQTNRITVAIHPLSGADQLDEFNSAFGRLAVTCTRATHGLLMGRTRWFRRSLGRCSCTPRYTFR
ncbi:MULTISPECIES: hypothetical protein [Mycobacterium]|uniref:hypothetical protein n=1 Tax=Mycobacterium TaxID=1763 RepID=UPI001F0CA702|nr:MULTISPECIES: hypothetical protein [Mycobacterium]MDM4141399.1 hypothetical protein [Mycobacterium sp. FLAC0960]